MNRTGNWTPRNGYDLPILGLDEGFFYELHVPTIVFISISFICAFISIIISFRRHRNKFSSWTKCDRLIVYLAICDGIFNLSHGSDHIMVVIIKDHVRPKELCELFGFVTTIFSMAQNLVVGIIAINIFMMIYFRKNLKFGKHDWILLVVTFGIPLSIGATAWILGLLGPNGFVCITDGVKGWTAFVAMYTVPLVLIVVMNVTLYTLTWLKMRSEIREIQKYLGQNAPSRKSAINAAKKMSIFVAAFFVQWCFAAAYGVWELFTRDVPVIVLHLVTKFPNIGGILNLCIFIILNRRRQKRKSTRDSQSVERTISTIETN